MSLAAIGFFLGLGIGALVQHRGQRWIERRTQRRRELSPWRRR